MVLVNGPDGIPRDTAPTLQPGIDRRVIAMAALGLGTEVRSLMRAGGRVTVAVAGSLLLPGGISLGLIQLSGIP